MRRILKKWLLKNWMAKIASLLLAIALWFLIDDHLTDKGTAPWFIPPPEPNEQTEF